MKLAQLLAQYEQALRDIGEEAESLSFVYRALKKMTFTDFVLALQAELNSEDQNLLKSIFEELARHRPAQYIIGQADFYGLVFEVDERVLIPRPETEELVDLILAENRTPDLAVLDIGTGSGAIAVSLAHARPDWQVTASDISADALAVAKKNADNLKQIVHFQQSDCFEKITAKYDIMISNPPYISKADLAEVGLNVWYSEPHLALFAEEDGLAIYRKIAEGAETHLKDGGKIYLEIGYKQGQAVAALFQQEFPHKRVRVLKDSFGQDRMVVVDDGQS